MLHRAGTGLSLGGTTAADLAGRALKYRRERIHNALELCAQTVVETTLTCDKHSNCRRAAVPHTVGFRGFFFTDYEQLQTIAAPRQGGPGLQSRRHGSAPNPDRRPVTVKETTLDRFNGRAHWTDLPACPGRESSITRPRTEER